MENKIQNTELLMNIFGKFPNFHDAEVVQTALKRKENGEYCPTLEASVLIKHYDLGDGIIRRNGDGLYCVVARLGVDRLEAEFLFAAF